jgi:hypothetical protein
MVPSALRAEPTPGEWYVVPQSALRVAAAYPDHVEHRWMVTSLPLAGQVALVLRTTKPGYSPRGHDRHPEGHAAECRIDEAGYLCGAEYHPLHQLHAATFSCDEPDRSLVDDLQMPMYPSRRPARRGRR